MTGRLHILRYDYAADVIERRGPYRDEHLERIRERAGRGEILMAGATGDPVSGAAIVFRGVDAAEIERFAAADPYVAAGLVTAWRIEPWNVVVSSVS